jgi:hypothetical protein
MSMQEKKKERKNTKNLMIFVTSSCCTSSSCDYWPPQSGSLKYPSENDKSRVNGGSRNKVNVPNDSDSSGNNVKVSVNTQKQKQQAFRSSTTVTINGGQATSSSLKHVKKPNNSSIIFLGDCEMPITKSAATRKNSGSDSSANKIAGDGKAKENNTQKIHITSRSNGDMKQQLAVSSQQIR